MAKAPVHCNHLAFSTFFIASSAKHIWNTAWSLGYIKNIIFFVQVWLLITQAKQLWKAGVSSVEIHFLPHCHPTGTSWHICAGTQRGTHAPGQHRELANNSGYPECWFKGAGLFSCPSGQCIPDLLTFGITRTKVIFVSSWWLTDILLTIFVLRLSNGDLYNKIRVLAKS